jgi:hypothetical protein
MTQPTKRKRGRPPKKKPEPVIETADVVDEPEIEPEPKPTPKSDRPVAMISDRCWYGGCEGPYGGSSVKVPPGEVADVAPEDVDACLAAGFELV